MRSLIRNHQNVAERLGLWRRAADILFKDLSLLASVYLARLIVRRELWRTRKPDNTRQDAVGERLQVAQERRLRMEQVRYFAEIRTSRRKDK